MCPQEPRPKLRSEPVRRAVIALLIKTLRQYDGGLPDNCTDEKLAEELEDAIDCHYGMDGYALASHLESEYLWAPDATLVEELDMCATYFTREHHKAVREWVVRNKVKAPFQKDTRATWILHGQPCKGVVLEVHEDTAEFIVKIDTDGPVPSKLEGSLKGLYALPYEEVTADGGTEAAAVSTSNADS